MHWRRKWQPTPVFLPGESQGWGSLVGCCLQGRTESDTTEVTYQQQQQAWKGFQVVLVVKNLPANAGDIRAAAAKSLQLCPTLCDPIDGSLPGSTIPGFSRQEHWSGLPFPSPMHESEK